MNEYNLKWSAEDREYVATCSDYPSLSYLDPNPLNAMKGLLDIIMQHIYSHDFQ